MNHSSLVYQLPIMHYFRFLLFLVSVCLASVWAGADESTMTGEQANADSRPNLLYIFPDQFRLQALGIWSQPGYDHLLGTPGDPVHTPNLDQLAREGVLFTQVTSTHPVCSVYRGMFMSGMYPSRNGIQGTNCKLGRSQSLKENIMCLTDVLHASGYETGYVGKTHWSRPKRLFSKDGTYVGTEKSPGGHIPNTGDIYIPPGPGRHGNVYWYQLFRNLHFDPLTYSSRPELVNGKSDGEKYRPRQFTVKLEADAVIDFLKNESEQRDDSKPFSMIWAPNPPHTPYDSIKDCDPKVYQKHYADVPADELLVRKNVRPIAPKSKKGGGKRSAAKCEPFYFSNVTSIDEHVGRVLAALKESGLDKNTIVVFTADHGEMMGSHGMM
ncbi:MAG: sulfatase-like hydrolase/transferase, partial [Planctomycetota bacterium]